MKKIIAATAAITLIAFLSSKKEEREAIKELDAFAEEWGQNIEEGREQPSASDRILETLNNYNEQ